MALPAANAVIPPALNERPIKNTVVLFDVDETLTPARRSASAEVLTLLANLRQKVAIGFVGGSNLPKQQEQLGVGGVPVQTMFDFCFSENGLIAYRMGEQMPSNSFIKWIGEEKYKKLSSFILHYIADLDIPMRRGTFIEFRNGMINVSPIGRNCSIDERIAYEKFDLEHKVREKFIEVLKKEFADLGLTFSIGGQVSFDIFPTGWDKTYCLRHIENDKNLSDGVDFTTIHFFGDKAYPGGNDWEIYDDPRTIGHSVKGPDDTVAQVKKLFDL